MTAERWQEVERIYHAALELALEQRQAYVADACAGDAELQREVESLVAAAAGQDSLIDDGGLAAAARLVAEPAQDLTGRKLGRYEVTRKLGSGGMGDVYLARDTRLAREVAIKILRPGSIDDTERNRLVREAKAASALRHPNIVTVHDFDTAGGIDFIVMEYVPGRMLSDLIGTKGLPVREALGYAIQIAEALATAHAAGIIHRDLKPANVIVDDSGTVKVLDFGLAKRAAGLSGDETQSLSGGLIAGTVAYMSPEQVEGKPLDPRTDVFSFGVVLYEMLSGRRAFERESTASTIAAILREEASPVALLNKRIPPELDRIVQRCLRKDSGRRCQSMADLKVALEDLQQPGPPSRTRRPLLRWAVALAAVLVAAGIGLRFYSSLRDRTPPRLVPLTSYPGLARSPSFSPDAKQVAFSWNGDKEDNFDIYVKYVDAPTAVRITTDPAPDTGPAWSPDGRSIAFLREHRGAKSNLVIVPAIGGPEQILAEVNSDSRLTWTPDGRFVALGVRDAADSAMAIYLYSFATGQRRQLTVPPAGSIGDNSPDFSADSRSMAFSRYLNMTSSEIQVLRLGQDFKPLGSPERVYAMAGTGDLDLDPVWSRDGRDLIFAGLLRLNFARRGPPEPLDNAAEGRNPAISPAGARLAFTRVRFDANVWHVVVDDGHAAIPEPLIASSAFEYNPQYSPDGRTIVFSATRSGGSEIWTCDRDGGNAIPLTNVSTGSTDPEQNRPSAGSPRWSPDGQRIVFDIRASGNRDIYTVGRTGGPTQRVTFEPSDEVVPSYSRDGKWLYFASNRTGRFEVWKTPVGGGNAIQVTKNGGHTPQESIDGRWLYFTKQPDRTLARNSPLWRVSVGGGLEEQVIDSVHMRAFDLTERGIYFLTQDQNSGRATLMFYEYARQRSKPMLAVAKPPRWGLAATKDGRNVLWAQDDVARSDLMMIEGFR